MDRQQFNEMLEKSHLTKESFSQKIGLQYRSVNNWGSGAQNVPHWVESWLELYYENQECKRIKEMIKGIQIEN
jgi:DNA-binding transcriptional regulator YiaG